MPGHFECSGSALKVLAMAVMVVDHTASRLLCGQPEFLEPLMTVGDRTVTWLFLMRCVGRLGFPLFAFLLVEGFLHTRNLRRYCCSILLLALLSEVPYDLFRQGVVAVPGVNALFTLLLGLLALSAIHRWEQRRLAACWLAVVLFAVIITAMLLRCDYGSSGVMFVVMLYVLGRQHVVQAAIGATMLPLGLVSALAFIPISLYNGQRGFIRGTIGKYIFYSFYPLHLLALYFLKLYLQN